MFPAERDERVECEGVEDVDDGLDRLDQPAGDQTQRRVRAVIGNRHPDMGDQAVGLELLQLIHPIPLDAPGRPPQVQLEQVQVVDPEFFEGAFGAGADLAAGKDGLDVDRHSPPAAGAERLDLGRDDRGVAGPAPQRLADQSLGGAVGAGGVDERHSRIECVMQRGDAPGLVGRPEPLGEAHGPETQFADLLSSQSKIGILHVGTCRDRRSRKMAGPAATAGSGARTPSTRRKAVTLGISALYYRRIARANTAESRVGQLLRNKLDEPRMISCGVSVCVRPGCVGSLMRSSNRVAASAPISRAFWSIDVRSMPGYDAARVLS